MTHYATRGAVLDRFLTEHTVDPDDILSVSMGKPVLGEGDIRVHVYDPIPGLEYVASEDNPRYTTARVDREDLAIDVIHVRGTSEEVTA